MTPTDGERLAVLEEKITDLRGDVQALIAEMERTRKRMHDTEGTLGGLVKTAEIRAQIAAEASQRQLLWIKILTGVVTCAGVIGPLVYTGVHH